MFLEYTIVGCLFFCACVLHSRFASQEWSTSLIYLKMEMVEPKLELFFFFNLLVGGLTLFCWSMAFAHWSMLSLLTPLEQTWYHGWLFSWGGYVIGGSNEGRTSCYLVDVFLPLAIEVFGFLHQHANNFFYWCANMMWTTMGTKGIPLLVLCSFYRYSVNGIRENASYLHLEMGCCSKRGFV